MVGGLSGYYFGVILGMGVIGYWAGLNGLDYSFILLIFLFLTNDVSLVAQTTSMLYLGLFLLRLDWEEAAQDCKSRGVQQSDYKCRD